ALQVDPTRPERLPARFTLDRIRVPCRIYCHICYNRRRLDTLPHCENGHSYILDG
ncbi:hypothetical protein KXV98_006423, partial [Aspergillus fumigatus]